jgi:hypothetical protein
MIGHWRDDRRVGPHGRTKGGILPFVASRPAMEIWQTAG